MTDRRTLIKIAHWYYERGMTQQQIATKLQFSRQRVNKIVNSLVDDGVVTIKINGIDQQFFRLENLLEDHFSLKQVIIADTDQAELPCLQIVGQKAAEFLDDYITDKKTIGISWGMTLGETVKQMRANPKPGCSVVQLVGGMNTSNYMVRPDEITRMLAQKLDCPYKNLYAPAILNSNIAREIIAKEESVQEVFESMQKCDIAIMGVGELEPESTTVVQGYINAEYLDMLRSRNYVGDVCFNHYKLNGEWEQGENNRLVIGVDLETLRQIPTVIAIGAGKHKVSALIGALNTGCLDILITDSATARAIAEKTGISY